MVSILIVDDSAINRRVAAAVLSKELMVEIDTAENGRYAVEAVRLNPYDLIIMDLDMPEIDGIGATRLIRLLETFNGERVPIIAYSSSQPPREDECLAAGMDVYLQKPAGPGELAKEVERLISTGLTGTASSVRWTFPHIRRAIAV